MADERKTYDLFAARLLNPDKGLGALIDNGITMQNTSLEDIDTYRNKAKVKEIFRKEDGSFDEENFKKFYDGIQKEFVAMNAIGTENFVLNSYEKAPGNFSVQYGQFIDLTPKTEHVDNPLDLSKGLVGFNEWSEPTKSAREAAQQNRYWDNDEKKWSDKTVNEAGILGLLTGKSLVYATYDDDVKDQNGNILHYKGEYKKDEFGNYYAETTHDEENLGKQFVTWSEVLTDDNSVWNKFDPFDSDDLNQNITRSLFKAAVIVSATMVNPEVGRTLFLSTAAVNLARNMPQIAKSINAFLGGKESKTLNKWDNFSRRFSDSQSDYSQEHFLSIENIINMATDSYMQLGQQRAIAMIPELFMDKAKMEKMANQAAMVATGYMSKPSAEMKEIHAALTKAVGPYRELQKMQNHATKLSSAISRAYLVATSVQDVYNQSKIYGFDDQTAGVISLATYGAMGKLFQSDYFRGYLYNSADWEARRDIRLIAKNYLKNNANKLRGEVAVATDKATKLATLKKWGNNFSEWFTDHVLDPKMGRHSIAAGAMGEGLEEVSEEVAQDLAYQVGKAWQSVKELITGNEYTNNYSYKDTDPLARYSQSFFGGALGGAVFKLADRIAFDKAGYKHWKDLMNSTNNSDLMKELVYYVSQGKTGVINEVIDKLEKAPIASQTISYLDNTSATTDPNQSQNAVLFNSLRKAINDLDTFLDNNNLKIDYDRFGDIELIKGIRVGWLTSVADHGKGIHDDLFNTYVKLLGDIAAEKSEIDNINATLKDTAKEEEKAEAKANIKKHQDIINFKKQQIANLMEGKDDSYIGRMMMESQPQLMDALAENSQDAISNNVYGMNYDELPDSYKKNVDEQIKNRNESGMSAFDYMAAWRTWKNLTKNEQLKAKLKAFDDEMQNNALEINDDLTQKKLSLYRYLVLDYNQHLDPDKRLTEMQMVNLIKTMANAKLDNLYQIGDVDDGLIDQYGNDALWAEEFGDLDNGFIPYARNKLNELQNLDSENLNEKLAQVLAGQNDDISEEEKLYLELNGKDGIAQMQKEIDDLDHNVPDILDAVMNPLNIISTNSFLKYIETIDKMINGDNSNLAGQLHEIFDKLHQQGNKFQLTKEQIDALNDLKKLFTLGSAILKGSNEEGEQLLEGAPFGANNFINKAAKEKGWDYELSQISKLGSQHGQSMAQQYNQLIDQILENDRNNKGMVPKLEKLLEAKLYRDINVRIVNWLSAIQSDEQGRMIYDLIKTFFESQPEDKRIDIDKLKAKIPPIVSETSTDEAILAATVEARNNCLAFESAFFNVCLQAQNGNLDLDYETLVHTCLEQIGGKRGLATDTASLDTVAIKDGIDEPIFCTDSSFAQYLMQCSYGQSGEALTAIKQQVNADPKYFPFGSQLNLVQHAVQFLTRGKDVRNNNKIWLQKLAELSENTNYDTNPIIAYGLKMVCSGGTGKTEVIIRLISNCLKTLSEGNPKIFYAANTDRQLKNLKEGLGNDIENLLISELVAKDETFWEEHKDGYLIIDEASNLTLDQIKNLDSLCDKYNINYILAGDTKQSGVAAGFSFANMAMTFRLNESKRVVDDINRDNLKEFEKIFDSDSEGQVHFNPLKIKKLQYWDKPDKFSGMKFLNSEMAEADILNFIKEHNIPKDSKILILSDKLTSLSNTEFVEYPNIEIEKDVSKIQGITWDYVINDLNLTVTSDGITTNGILKFDGDVQRTEASASIRSIYTIISRPRHGFLSFKPIKFVDTTGKTLVEFGESKNVFESKFAPIASGLLNDTETLNSTIEFEKKVLEQLNIPDGVKLKPTQAPEAAVLGIHEAPGSTVMPPVTEVKPKAPPTAPVGSTTTFVPASVSHVPSNMAQITAGFIPRAEFVKNFGQQFGLNDEQYLRFRALVYTKLTNSLDNADELLQKLNPGLENGKFVLKSCQYSAEDLYDLASLGRDSQGEKQWLNKPHLYIIYRVNGHDITLGMVKTAAQAKKRSNEKTNLVTNTLAAFDELDSKTELGTEYDIDPFVKNGNFSRSSNIVDFRSLYDGEKKFNYKIEFRNGQLYVVTQYSEDNKTYDTHLSSLGVYTISEGLFFSAGQNATSSGGYLPTNEIVHKLSKIREGYTKILGLAKKGTTSDTGVKIPPVWSEDDTEIDKLFINYFGWKKSKYPGKPPYLGVRDVPDLQHHFVVFAKLNTDGTPLSLVDGAQSYNMYLTEHLKQINQIIDVLESNKTADEKKAECEEIISHRILQPVAPIGFSPSVLANEETARNEQIDKIFETLKSPTIERTLSTGSVVEASVKSYNYHLRNQLWTLLYSMEAINKELSEGNTLFRNIDDDEHNNRNAMVNALNKAYKLHRQKLIDKYNELFNKNMTESDSDTTLLEWLFATAVKPLTAENDNFLQSEEVKAFVKDYYNALLFKFNSPGHSQATISAVIKRINDRIIKRNFGNSTYIPYLCERLLLDSSVYIEHTADESSEANIYDLTQKQLQNCNGFGRITNMGIQLGVIQVYADSDDILNLKPISSTPAAPKDTPKPAINPAVKPPTKPSTKRGIDPKKLHGFKTLLYLKEPVWEQVEARYGETGINTIVTYILNFGDDNKQQEIDTLLQTIDGSMSLVDIETQLHQIISNDLDVAQILTFIKQLRSLQEEQDRAGQNPNIGSTPEFTTKPEVGVTMNADDQLTDWVENGGGDAEIADSLQTYWDNYGWTDEQRLKAVDLVKAGKKPMEIANIINDNVSDSNNENSENKDEQSPCVEVPF